MKMTGAFGQGIVSGFQTGWGMVDDLKKQKEAKDAITKSAEQYKTNMMSYANQMDTIWKDGTITDIEHRDTMGLVMTLGKDFVEQYNAVYKDYKTTNLETTKRQLEEVEAAYEIYADFDFQNPEEFKQALDLLESRTKSEDVKAKIDYIRKSIETRQPKEKLEVERYASLAEFQKVYGEEVAWEYDKEGYIRQKPTTPITPAALTDYQRKRANIQASTTLSKEEKERGIYKLDTGLDIDKNDTENDFTTTEGKRTADFGLTQMFGYTTPDGIKIAGIVPSRLATQLSLGRKATEAEKEVVMFDWNARKAVTQKMGGKMVVEYIEGILNQLFGETKPEDVVPESDIGKAIKYIKETLSGEEPPVEEAPVETPVSETPTVPAYGKEALVPTMTKEEVRKALSETDPSDPLYAILYERAIKEGWQK